MANENSSDQTDAPVANRQNWKASPGRENWWFAVTFGKMKVRGLTTKGLGEPGELCDRDFPAHPFAP
jgi:hypothetical protein